MNSIIESYTTKTFQSLYNLVIYPRDLVSHHVKINCFFIIRMSYLKMKIIWVRKYYFFYKLTVQKLGKNKELYISQFHFKLIFVK